MNKIILVVIVCIILGSGVVFWHYQTRNAAPVSQITTTATTTTSTDQMLPSGSEYAGTITTDANGNNVFTSAKYRLSFTYPKGWSVNNGEYFGYYRELNIYNYDPSNDAAGGKQFQKGQNGLSIDVVSMTTLDAVDPISDNPDQEDPVNARTIEDVFMHGEKIPRLHVVFASGAEGVVYLVPIPAEHVDPAYPNGTHLLVSIGGDTADFYVLDDVVKSISWLQK